MAVVNDAWQVTRFGNSVGTRVEEAAVVGASVLTVGAAASVIGVHNVSGVSFPILTCSVLNSRQAIHNCSEACCRLIVDTYCPLFVRNHCRSSTLSASRH